MVFIIEISHASGGMFFTRGESSAFESVYRREAARCCVYHAVLAEERREYAGGYSATCHGKMEI